MRNTCKHFEATAKSKEPPCHLFSTLPVDCSLLPHRLSFFSLVLLSRKTCSFTSKIQIGRRQDDLGPLVVDLAHLTRRNHAWIHAFHQGGVTECAKLANAQQAQEQARGAVVVGFKVLRRGQRRTRVGPGPMVCLCVAAAVCLMRGWDRRHAL